MIGLHYQFEPNRGSGSKMDAEGCAALGQLLVTIKNQKKESSLG